MSVCLHVCATDISLPRPHSMPPLRVFAFGIINSLYQGMHSYMYLWRLPIWPSNWIPLASDICPFGSFSGSEWRVPMICWCHNCSSIGFIVGTILWPNWFCCLNFQYLAISSSCECLTNFYLNIAWKWHVKVATFQPQQSQIPWVGHLPHLISIEHPGPFKLNGSYVSAFLAAIWPYLLHYVLASTELCCKIVATSIIPLGSHLAVAKTNTGGKGQKQPTHTQGMPINCGGK